VGDFVGLLVGNFVGRLVGGFVGILVGDLVGIVGDLGAPVGVGSAFAGANGALGADGELGAEGALGADGALGAEGEPGVDGELADGVLAVDGALGAEGAGADGTVGALGALSPMEGAVGDEGAEGDVMYLQHRGVRRPRSIKRRQIFLPSLVLQKNADDGVLQLSNTANAKSIQDVSVMLLLQSGFYEMTMERVVGVIHLRTLSPLVNFNLCDVLRSTLATVFTVSNGCVRGARILTSGTVAGRARSNGGARIPRLQLL
jgi:hypothetical protein